MATLPWPAGQTPYLTPDQLGQWPIGVQISTLPPLPGGASASQQYAVQSMICQQATVKAEQIARQPLRAVIVTEELAGPNMRLTVQADERNARFTCLRTPVTSVLAVQVCPNDVWPRQWQSLPAGTFEPEFPVLGLYGTSVPSGAGEGGQTVLFQRGWINWRLGRYGWRVKVTYASCWPHTCLTAAAASGAMSIAVDDCTMWAPQAPGSPGAAGIVYDALVGGQESVTCTAATAASGPGTLTLASPLAFGHAPGIMVSTLPQTAIWGTALLAGEAALMRGATATTIQTTSGRQQTANGSVLRQMAADMLSVYRVTV